jgi:hypothetical protein|nr:MAG TPA: YopX protein [Caudoviricetes sp.]
MTPRFRAWDKKTQTMLDVSLIDFKKSVLIGEHWEFGETNFINFDEIELMQSTGLKDKNGKEIFEGDIITNGKDVMSIKRHDTLGFYIDFKGKIDFIADCADLEEFEEDAKEIADSIEIIGNVYENKGLLEDNR